MQSKPTSPVLLLALIALFTAVIYLPSFDLPIRKGAINDATFPLTFGLVKNVPAFIFQIENPLSLGFIRPVSHFLLYIDFLISGYQPFGLRLTHLLLHIGNIVGVYFLGKLLFQESRWAIFAAALFAFHPNAVEAIVATLPQDLLAGWFFLWGLWAWGNYLTRPRRRIRFLVTTLFSLALGLLSKELLLLFPVAAFCLQFTFLMENRLSKFTLRPFFPGYLAQAAVIAGYWVYRVNVLGGVGGYIGAKHFLPSLYMIPNSIHLVNGAFYVERKLGALDLHNPLWIAGTIAALLITLSGLIPRRRGSRGWGTVFAFLFMFIAAGATLNFRWLGWWYVYVPLAGISLGIAGLMREAHRRIRKLKAVFFVAGGLVVLLAFLTAANLGDLMHRWDPKLKMYRKVGEIMTQRNDPAVFIWRKRTGALMRFNRYDEPVLDPQTHALWADNRIKVVCIEDAAGGGILVGYNIVPPYILRPDPDDPLYRLQYRDGNPSLTPLAYDVLQREIRGKQRSREAGRRDG